MGSVKQRIGLLLQFNRKMSTSYVSSGRKPLATINHQQNNPSLLNKRTLQSYTNCKQTIRKKPTIVVASHQKRIKSTEVENERHKTDHKCARYYDFFERDAEEIERQEQSCQNYFLRRTVMALYKLFQRMQRRWNLLELNHSQLLKIMRELGYLRKEGEERHAAKASEDLRQCFWLWINISQGRSFSLTNLLIALFCLQHLEPDAQLISDIVNELGKGIAKFTLEETAQEAHFIFLVKNEKLPFEQGVLKLDRHHISHIENNLKDLKLNKLMQNSSYQLREEQGQTVTLSKKSEQLAEGKRQKIIKQIRQNQPHVKEIQLHHILSYKTEKCKGRQRMTTQVNSTDSNTCKSLQQKKKEISVILPKKKSIKSSQRSNYHTQPKRTVPDIQEQVDIKKCSKIQSKESQESFQFCSSEELFGGDKTDPPKQKIIEELQWEEIPKPPEEISIQHQLLQEEYLLEPPLTHLARPIEQKGQQGRVEDRQRKRKEFIQLPILFVDVNIEEGRKERIVIYQGDHARDLAIQFGRKHNLSNEMVDRLQGLLQLQIGSILTKIDEAIEQDCSDLY